MSAGSWIVALVLLAIVVAIVVYLVRSKRQGKHVGCDCSGCGACGCEGEDATAHNGGQCCQAATDMIERAEHTMK